jgi:hypothetical protein
MTTNSSTSSTTSTFAVHTDTKIAGINGRISTQQRIIDSSLASIDLAQKAIARALEAGRTSQARPYGIDIDAEWEKIGTATRTIDALAAEVAPLNAIYAEYRWSRFFLVTNANGHIHSSTCCGTCFPSTQFNWLTDLSGLTEAEAVDQYGEILCSVCFPSAPVEWTSGTSNADKAAKAERAAAKAERAAKKLAKALVPEDVEGGLVFTVNGDRRRLTTITAAKSYLTDGADWNSCYPRQFEDGSFQLEADGTVQTFHPSYPPEAIALVADVLAERLGTDPEAEIAAAAKRAAKRR